ncbi:hypothetical protein [Aureispira sp. CCB-QB1]|uniref:hypothetical protein n=1 Tax=Aureispira sp. CCB-QB1 TaxID=1313421 RepID=UPI0006970E36|nr:hypothetical protein [Aureispira sp. CCB-QB1]
MKYQEINLEVKAPISFVFDFISLHENFQKLNIASSLYECEFIDKDLLEDGKSVKAGVVYNLKITAKKLTFYLGCLTLAVEKDKLIQYRYIYNDIIDLENPLMEDFKSTMLDSLNATPFEGSWIVKDLGGSTTELKILIEVNGKLSFFKKIYYWFFRQFPSQDKKEGVRLFKEIKKQIESEYQASNS